MSFPQDAVIPRRRFMGLLGLATAGTFLPWTSAVAGTLGPGDFEKLVPVDKHLDPAWIASLFARGTPTVYQGAELARIGMPIGGIGAGQLYLGGDGTLRLWEIFNDQVHTNESHYAQPPHPKRLIKQGFALRVLSGESPKTWSLDAEGFPEVTFCGQYPIGMVNYRRPDAPVSVSLEAFSPFIPLNADDSSLPATYFQFTLKNTSSAPVALELAGWLENAVCRKSAEHYSGIKVNRCRTGAKAMILECSVETNGPASSNLVKQADFGSLALALLDPVSNDRIVPVVTGEFPDAAFFSGAARDEARANFDPKENTSLVGSLVRRATLAPGESQMVSFVLSWFFPNLVLPLTFAADMPSNGRPSLKGRHYATKFASASAVASYLANEAPRLIAQTRLWRDTWYESTLPYWFLDRTLLNISILATNTVYRLADGRFYAWEGVGSCGGTCTHVWSYEQAMGRLFPELDISLRERVDYNPGVGFNPNLGTIGNRAEIGMNPAADGQAGTILRTYRDYLVSPDDAFLRRNWPNIKKAISWLFTLDKDGDGILDRPQDNTLDAAWYGKVPWISGLALAAVRAGEQMAGRVGDADFVLKCKSFADLGSANFVRYFWNGEYFQQVPDPARLDQVGSYDGCEIDQVLGQSWAFQAGLGRLFAEKQTKQALQSLWKYNFATDVGPFRHQFPTGRWFAMPGEAGLIMCSWPRGDKMRITKGFDSYFNECMNGFEHQVAGHMIWEGMVQEGLAIERAVHDRYAAGKRNPWNEIECGDHYARSMASYGVFLAACGFEYHGPEGHIGFRPHLTPEDFQAAFTTAEGWGSYAQKQAAGKMEHSLSVNWGRLRVLSLAFPAPAAPVSVGISTGGREVSAKHSFADGRVLIRLDQPLTLNAGEKLSVALT